MMISESDRRAIFVGLEPILGPDAADNLMSLLPQQPASELVTRADLHANTALLRGEMSELRSELKGEMSELRAELKGDMTELRSELKGEMSELRSELKGEMSELRAEFRSEFATLRITTQRWMSGAALANAVAMVTALLT